MITTKDPHSPQTRLVRTPTDTEAYQFAQMIHSGYPPDEAIRYFSGMNTSHRDLTAMADAWRLDAQVQADFLAFQGKPFQEMSLNERIKYSLDMHYSQLAYFLYSHNYSEMSSTDQKKADAARAALEANVAGTSGQFNPLQAFWAESLKAGKFKVEATQTTQKKSLTLTGDTPEHTKTSDTSPLTVEGLILNTITVDPR